jgi:microcompartment protein CcmL/EutN
MASRALGLIETIGLPTAIEAADAAAKSANITLLGYENARGGGRITVKMTGDVGAVQAAVSAGVAAAMRIGQVMSCLVIPRPHEQIETLANQVDHGRVTVAPVAALPPAEAATSKPAAAKPAAAGRRVPPKPTAPTVAAKPKASVTKPAPAMSSAAKPKASAAKAALIASPAAEPPAPPAPLTPPAEPPAPPAPANISQAQSSAPDRLEDPPAILNES